ncbi:MAG: PHP domain-containing protein [Oscillospiraceae bacterium]
MNQLKNALKLNECHIACIFSEDALIPAACADIVAELKVKNAALNGYFNGAEFKLKNNNVKITLKFGGYDTITDCGFENAFKRIIKDRFGRDITVSFDGQLEKVEIDLPPAEPAQPVRRPERQTAEPRQSAPAHPAAPKKEIKFEKREGRPENGIVYLDNPQQFYGRGGISNHTRDMISITGDDTEIACWGEVFGLETRDIKTKRGTDMTIVNFSFSDHTNSLNASLFIDTHRMGDIAPLKDGAFILVNGSYEFDNYKKDFVVKPRAMALLQKYTEKDEHEGESALNCTATPICPQRTRFLCRRYCRQAYEWGHKAIAITDHGVVQAYPRAAGAVKAIRKSGGDFKVIYGVESYFVDDVNNDVKDLNAKQTAKFATTRLYLLKISRGLKPL